MTTVEDRVANRVLQKCSQAIVDLINIDEVTLRLHSKSRLTLQEFDRLESFSTAQEKKKQFYRIVLADKGSAAYEDILEVLNDTEYHKPHVELADKLRKCHKCLLRRMTHSRSDENAPENAQLEEVSTASINMGEETTTACLERRLDSDDGSDVDDGDQFPDILCIETTARTNRSRKVLVQQKVSAPVSRSPSHRAADGPAASVVLSLSVGSLTTVTHLPSSIQESNDHTLYQQSVTSVKTPALINTGQPVGVSGKLDQSEQANLVASTVTKESGFSDSYICNVASTSVLRKSSLPLPDMIHVKVLLLGNSGVGKTSLAYRYLHGVYSNSSPATVGIRLDQCYYQHVQKGVNIKLSVWDTAGQERFNWITPNTFRGIHAAIIVFDMGDLSSLVSVKDWKMDLFKNSPRDSNVPVLLVGNKCDSLEADKDIRRHAQQIAERYGFNDFVEASAKTNHNVESIFEKVVSLVLEQMKHNEHVEDNICLDTQPNQYSSQRHQSCQC